MCSAGNQTQVSRLLVRCLTTRPLNQPRHSAELEGPLYGKLKLKRIAHFLLLGSRHYAQVDQRFRVNFPLDMK